MISRLGGLEIRYKGGIYILKNKVLFSSITSLVVFLSIFCINGRASKGVDVTEARESMVAPAHQTIAASEDTAEIITIADESVTEGATDGTPEAETEAEIEEESVPETTTVVKETETERQTTKTPEPETTTQTAIATEAKAENNEQIINVYHANNGLFKVTGYYPSEGFPRGQKTASGVGVGPGQCAMDQGQREELGLHYGDKIYVEGVGVLTITDCGCDEGTIDVWCETKAEASRITGNAEYTHAVYRVV
ncbi:hypothetical protein IKG45_00855 [Candidatus Saccharibacteria bacterium]|nr:hypothetical protein [Candidatus Saccharibacteria bacterium]